MMDGIFLPGFWRWRQPPGSGPTDLTPFFLRSALLPGIILLVLWADPGTAVNRQSIPANLLGIDIPSIFVP
jgi:hypothetical protein